MPSAYNTKVFQSKRSVCSLLSRPTASGLRVMRAQAITHGVPVSVENAPEWLAPILVELGRSGVDPERWLRASLRLVPSVILVPAFGLRALPFPAQLLFAFVLSGATLPALAATLPPSDGPWLMAALAELLRGLPVAVSAAAAIW